MTTGAEGAQVSPGVGARTRLLGIVGHPIRQVKSPGLINPWLAAHAVDAVLLPLDVTPEAFDGFMAGIKGLENLDGLILTLPHKRAGLRHVDRITARARLAGAINVMRRDPGGRWWGDALDGEGFVRSLVGEGFDPRGRRALVVGAGGAGAAIAIALIDAGVGALALCDIDGARVAALAAALGGPGRGITVQAVAEPGGVDLVVNATPLGMAPGDPVPLDPELLSPGTRVADLVTEPEATRLLLSAAARGCALHPGFLLTRYQRDLLIDFLLPTAGLPAPGAGERAPPDGSAR